MAYLARGYMNPAIQINIMDLVKGSLILLPGREKHGSYVVREIIHDTIKKSVVLTVSPYGSIISFRERFSETQQFVNGK